MEVKGHNRIFDTRRRRRAPSYYCCCWRHQKDDWPWW